MEPIFAESASETVTAELRAQLDAAVAALPPAHCLNHSSSFGLSSCRTWILMMKISWKRAPPLRWAPYRTSLTMRMMLGPGLAASLAAKLSLLRSHLVMRAIASFVDLAVSKKHLGLWNHSSGRLTTVSCLLLVPEPKPRLYEGLYQKLWNCASQATIAIVMTFAKF